MDVAPAPDHRPRQRWMAVLARADADALKVRVDQVPDLPQFTRLRGPETGLALVRGRAGGTGAPFNLGEMSVTRCSVRAGGRTGHANIAGRDQAKAELAARLDAALQDPALRDALLIAVIEPLAAAQNEDARRVAGRAAATQVKFFTMATMRS